MAVQGGMNVDWKKSELINTTNIDKLEIVELELELCRIEPAQFIYTTN